MCILALLYRVAEEAPVIAAANREEYYARGGDPPRVLLGSIPALCGIDPHAGGTWLGVNAAGLLVAVTNRHKTRSPSSPRSRGLLVRDLLVEETSARQAAQRAMDELSQEAYLGCNLVVADARSATVLHGGEWLRVHPLPPGLHILTNGDINDERDPRIRRAADLLAARPRSSPLDWVNALQEVCAYTGPEPPAICWRDADRGTVSSSIVAVSEQADASLYLHAQGPPDRVPYQDYSDLLREIRRRR
jgi:hypothetical protein